jgi:uncharacterized protein
MMKMKKISILFNPSKKIIPDVLQARSPIERMIGLLKHQELSEEQGMMIESCKQVHTLFMKFSIDAIFIDKRGVVVGVEELKPWRFSKIHWRANSVIETPYGWAKRNGISVGEKIEVQSC